MEPDPMQDVAEKIREEVARALGPRGFRRHGDSFTRLVNDCFQVVHLQQDEAAASRVCRFHTYVGVHCPRLQDGPITLATAKIYHCHWFVRTTDLQPEGRGEPHEATDLQEAAQAVHGILQELPLALEVMESVSSYDALIRIPKGMLGRADDPPGSCDWPRIDAHRMMNGLPAHVEIPYDWERKTLWHERRYGDPPGGNL
ncbi:DUF4304 domain-containing protein [bacterium]|nr:MAG: DUF4304 domain-containing protein [bacterium]